MHWTTIIIFAAVAILYIFVKRSGQISAPQARDLLKDGAMVVDVRTPAEFKANHLPGALSVPLDKIEIALPARVKDKDQAILLHCQSGFRSNAAKKTLVALGYTNVYNLGSYQRAARIMKAARG